MLDRDELQQRVWNVPYRARDRSVDVCVRKLREKLDRRSTHSYIQTQYGVGYRFDPTPRPRSRLRRYPRGMATVSTAPLRIEDAAGVRTLVLNRPERRNALSLALLRDLLAALAETAADTVGARRHRARRGPGVLRRATTSPR